MKQLRASQVYIIMMFVTALANSTMFTTYAIYYVTELGLTPFQLVLIGTVLELAVLVFEGITGVVADTYSRRMSVIIGMLVMGIGFVLEGSVIWIVEWSTLLPVFIWMLIAQLFFGIGATFVSGADTAWIVDEIGEDKVGTLFMRSQRLALFAALIGIGLSVGFSTLAPNLPYIIGGMFYVGLGIFLLVYMQETNFAPQPKEAHASPLQAMADTWMSGIKVVRRQPLLIMLIVVTIFIGAASEGYDRLRETFLINEIGFPQHIPFSMAVWFGILSAVSTMLGLVAVRVMEQKLDMSDKRAVTTAMLLLFAARIAALISIALSTSFVWAMIGLLLISVIGILSQPVYNTWLNMNMESKTRATVLSMVSQADAFGQTAGGPVIGWAGSRFSLRASFILAGVFIMPVLVVLRRFISSNPRE